MDRQLAAPWALGFDQGFSIARAQSSPKPHGIHLCDICWAEPVRNPTFPLAPVRKAPHFFGLHDEALWIVCARLGDDDPPVSHKSINGFAERDRWFKFRKCLDLNA